MVDLASLQKRFPHYKIRSQPAPGCTCNDGVRRTKGGSEFPCLCVCISAPSPGEPEYRNELRKIVAGVAKKELDAMEAERPTTQGQTGREG